MHFPKIDGRGTAAIACLLAFVAGYLPAQGVSLPNGDDARVIALLNGQSCGQREARATAPVTVAQFTVAPSPTAPSVSPSPSGSPSAVATPSFPPPQNATTELYATPMPRGSTPGPPPVPTPTPAVFDQNAPVFVQRGGETPPAITPAGEIPPTPTPTPSGVPTLAPNYVAVLADQVLGNTNQGQPGDAVGNVHILYGQEEIVGDRAHYDGVRTITITGNPFIIDHARDSVLRGDEISFDTIDQTAKLTNGRGTSAQGVERGLVHFNAKNLHTDANGVGHGLAPSVTTCERARSGYHITGRNMDVFPGDKIVIYRAILWLGAAAIFFLPKVVIPLRTVQDETQRPKYFPDVGYDQYDGYWVKTHITFGKDQYYYGYYTINYFTKAGLGLGYTGFFAKRSGHRSASVDYYGIHDRRTASQTYNLRLNEIENFSQRLRGNFGFNYQSNYGPYTNIPANTSFTSSITHATNRTSQNYAFQRNSIGTQSSSNSLTFSDQRQITQTLGQQVNYTVSTSQSLYGGVSSSNSTAHVTTLTHLTTSGADYQLTFDKNFAQTSYGINKEPELAIRPNRLFPHFFLPVSGQFTLGEYTEPSNKFSSQRADMAFVLGPEIAKIFGSDFTANMNVRQDYYGTGDAKAQIQQTMSLITPVGRHFVNQISYNESNYNGPPFVPFQFLDQQPTTNAKNAQDLMRIFNGDTYTLSLGFSTNFNAMAQPVSYQFTARPSRRSVLLLGGSFNPGPNGFGTGFMPTNVQLSTPFGRDAAIQFIGDLDWKNKGRIENKVIYYTKTIGDCYQIQTLYNQSQKLITVSINLLAFPSRAATFGIGQSGPLIPSSFNF